MGFTMPLPASLGFVPFINDPFSILKLEHTILVPKNENFQFQIERTYALRVDVILSFNC